MRTQNEARFTLLFLTGVLHTWSRHETKISATVWCYSSQAHTDTLLLPCGLRMRLNIYLHLLGRIRVHLYVTPLVPFELASLHSCPPPGLGDAEVATVPAWCLFNMEKAAKGERKHSHHALH